MNLDRAIRLQKELARRLILEWRGGEVSLVGGADFSYDKKEELIAAVVVVMKLPGLEMVETAEAVMKIGLPYIPGFLSLRETPAFFAAFQKIKRRPDVTLLDGNGIAHPRRMGLASHAGVVLDIPTIGCAKTPFFPFRPPPPVRGAFTYFKNDAQEKVGFCLRTRTGVKPVFVSPGHRVTFLLSRKIVQECCRFRIPEPIRQAHLLSRRIFGR
ncbi:MAG: endonuclease V [Clostridiales bacterium]|jgi:deoxyribonuclease V|nr:endonuclease V [Clostridiales bacterium]